MNIKSTTMRKFLLFVFCLPIIAQAQVNQDSINIKKMVDEMLKSGSAGDKKKKPDDYETAFNKVLIVDRHMAKSLLRMPHYTGKGLDWYELLEIRLSGIINLYFAVAPR